VNSTGSAMSRARHGSASSCRVMMSEMVMAEDYLQRAASHLTAPL
jgi:hypothetical protein